MVYYKWKIKTAWGKGRLEMVRESMCFDNFCDFYDRREYIRASYVALPKREKALYKYYVYSRRVLRDKACDAIWEYLNSHDGEDRVVCIGNLNREHSKYL